MAFKRFQVEIRNSAAGAGNAAFCRLDLEDPNGWSINENVAAIIGYFAGPGDAAVNTSITGVTYQQDGVGTLIPVNFPVADYAALRASYTFLPAMAAYGTLYGSGALASAGSSVTVSTYSTLHNRHGYGRHYRPFLSSTRIDGSGAVAPAYTAGIEEAYLASFVGVVGTTWAPAFARVPLVVSSTAGAHQILNVKASNQVANLHTRRK